MSLLADLGKARDVFRSSNQRLEGGGKQCGNKLS